jgi:glycosyltransferase involved in cell wall biosynthesis
MIVRNEERNLPRSLGCVLGLASEAIVVDTGSTDATPRITAAYGATVLTYDFHFPDFAAARNYALAHATGEWILILDADETLHATAASAIRSLIARNENIGYYFERHNHAAGHAAPTTDYAVRLFPNHPEFRFRGRVHETVDASILRAGGTLRKTQVRLDHNFSTDLESRRQRNRWYIKILLEEIAADPTDDTRLDFLAAEYHQLEMFSEAAAVAERIVQIRPQDPRAHLVAGIYHLVYTFNPTRARTDFEQALHLRPDFAEAESYLRGLRHFVL